MAEQVSFMEWRDQFSFLLLTECSESVEIQMQFWTQANGLELLSALTEDSKQHPKAPSSPQSNLEADLLVEEAIAGAQLLTPERETIEDGAIDGMPPRDVAKSKQVVKALCRRIEQIQQSADGAEQPDHIFTVPVSSTPLLSSIYNKAADGLIPDEGLTGPSPVGCLPAEESTIQVAIEEQGGIEEQILRSWGFNFNDSKFDKKRNLYHVIYTGDHLDCIYRELNVSQVLGWASHIKCKGGMGGRFSGRIHTHNLVAAVTPFNNQKANYDRDYKTIV